MIVEVIDGMVRGSLVMVVSKVVLTWINILKDRGSLSADLKFAGYSIFPTLAVCGSVN